MNKKYVLFWSIITAVVLLAIVGTGIYIKTRLQPISQVVQAAKTAESITKIITQPQKITQSDVENIANVIINTINPAISSVPKTPKDTTLKTPSQMIFVGINKTLDTKTPFNTEIEYMRQLKKSDFYLTTGIEIPISNDADVVKNQSKIKLGLVWRR